MTIRSRTTERGSALGRRSRRRPSSPIPNAEAAIAEEINALEDAGAPSAAGQFGEVIDFRAAHRQRPSVVSVFVCGLVCCGVAVR